MSRQPAPATPIAVQSRTRSRQPHASTAGPAIDTRTSQLSDARANAIRFVRRLRPQDSALGRRVSNPSLDTRIEPLFKWRNEGRSIIATGRKAASVQRLVRGLVNQWTIAIRGGLSHLQDTYVVRTGLPAAMASLAILRIRRSRSLFRYELGGHYEEGSRPGPDRAIPSISQWNQARLAGRAFDGVARRRTLASTGERERRLYRFPSDGSCLARRRSPGRPLRAARRTHERLDSN